MDTQLARLQPTDLEMLERTGKLLAASGYFAAKGDATMQMAQMAVKIMAGREIGFGPFASANGIHIIDGKPSISANLMATAVRSSRRYDYRVCKLSETECEIEFFALVTADCGLRTADKSSGSPSAVRSPQWESLGISRFDTADAARAGLTNKDNWKRHPKNMLFARAISNGVRFYTPDVFGGNAVYVPEELGIDVEDTTEPLPANTRIIDGNTGEILQPADEDMGMGGPQQRKLGSITRAQEKELHALGQSTYNGGWDEQRHKLVAAVTKGKHESIHDLTQAQAGKLIDGLHERLRTRILAIVDTHGFNLADILLHHEQVALESTSAVALTHIWKDVQAQSLPEAA